MQVLAEVGFSFVVDDQIASEDERLNERHPVIPLGLSNTEPSECLGAQARDLSL
jgi:hypothetical protein